MNFLPVSSVFRDQHEASLALAKSITENKAKTDHLRDARKSETECLDWTCNGERILVCSRDGSLKMWRTDRLFEERAWTGSWTWVESHPTNSNIFCAVSWDGRIKIVDIKNAGNAVDYDVKKIRGDKFDKLLYVTWKLEGKTLAIITRSDTVHVIDIDSLAGAGGALSLQPGGEVYSALFDIRGRLWLATGGTPGKILIFSSDYAATPTELVAHSHMTTCLARTRDNKFILSGGGDALVALWDTESDACIRTFSQSISAVTCLSPSFDGELIAWGSGLIGGRDGESVLSLAGISTGVHYASHPVNAPITRLKWHPAKKALAFSMQQTSNPDLGITIISFPSLD